MQVADCRRLSVKIAELCFVKGPSTAHTNTSPFFLNATAASALSAQETAIVAYRELRRVLDDSNSDVGAGNYNVLVGGDRLRQDALHGDMFADLADTTQRHTAGFLTVGELLNVRNRGTVVGLGLCLGMVALLVQGGSLVGFHLKRLGNFLPGYDASWMGAGIGLVEGAAVGFAIGAFLALLWNAYHRVFMALVFARERSREMRRELQEL